MKIKPIRILKQYQEKLYKKERVQILLFNHHEIFALVGCGVVTEEILQVTFLEYIVFNQLSNSIIKQIDYKNLYKRLGL